MVTKSQVNVFAIMATVGRASTGKMTIRPVFRYIASGPRSASGVRKLSKFPCYGPQRRPIMRCRYLLHLGLSSVKWVAMRLFPVNSPVGRENAGVSAVLLVVLALLAFPALSIAR